MAPGVFISPDAKSYQEKKKIQQMKLSRLREKDRETGSLRRKIREQMVTVQLLCPEMALS